MMVQNDGRVGDAEQALVSDQAPAGLAPTGFDPSRITELVQGIDEKCLAPIIKKAADDFYEQVLISAQYYLAENLDYNLRTELDQLRSENQKMRSELYEIRRMVGNGHAPQSETLQAIAIIDRNACLYSELIYAVGVKHDGETRHETALRYIVKAEAPNNDQACAKLEQSA